MARLNICLKEDEREEEDDDLPDPMAVLQASKTEKALEQANKSTGGQNHEISRKYGGEIVRKSDIFANIRSRDRFTTLHKPLDHEHSKCTPPTSPTEPIYALHESMQDKTRQKTSRIRSTPKRNVTKSIDYSIFSASKEDTRVSSSEEDESFTDLSGFIVPDSESDDGYQRQEAKPKRSQRSSKSKIRVTQSLNDGKANHLSSRTPEVTDLLSTSIKIFDSPVPPSMNTNTPLRGSKELSMKSTSLEEGLSQLRLSAPRWKKPSSKTDLECPITPPSSPSKPTLGSPSKKHRIPPSPHRPSIDAFWSQDVVNDWNDEHSPKKGSHTSGRDRLLRLDGNDESYFSSSASPRKSPTKSPGKKERQALRIFGKEKAELAIAFLDELDERISNHQLADLTAATGGMRITWSKKLSSTAGRANWRREAVRRRNPEGIFSETTYLHHASIELAEKVIDCEERLINVLAHEYCHLANFMISGVKDQPHGKEFKIWASKVTRAFKNRGVEVTTKHGYDITYKYRWICGSCDLEYKRHSKSIDPAKHSCGICKGKLVQVLPAPRRENEYQRFVKANWDRAKKSAGDGAGMGEINALLAKEWEARKMGLEKSKQLDVEVAEVAENTSDESNKRRGSPELYGVARKLDFLTLGT